MVAQQYPAEGEVLVEVGPVEAEGGEFDVVEDGVGLAGEAGVVGDGEGMLNAALHDNEDVAVPVGGACWGIH